MPRPRLLRDVHHEPGVTYFKPAGIRMNELEEIVIAVDEFEAIRLKDLIGMDDNEASKKMNVSQPTFNRIVNSARRKISEALINGKAIRIEGGNFRFRHKRGI
jgi:predicted DNA-binding protein (UPF0251 family)